MPLPILRNTGAQPRAGEYPDSPQFRDGFFHNSQPSQMVEETSRGSIARDFARKGRSGKPQGAIPLADPDLPTSAAACAATWLGHATVLLEVAGHWVLADPVWSERISPSALVGPRRHHQVPLALQDLPPLSAVLISHDHYDHLDTRTVEWLSANQQVPFIVPLGIGAHLRRWNVAENRIVELDWGQTHTIDDLRLTCAEAQHFSGRLFTNNTTLWSSWVISAGSESDERTVFFGGDTGYHEAFVEFGHRHRGFDLALLPIGAYDQRWPDVHMDPTEAIRAHLDIRGGVLLPIHWATFDLAFHPWVAPIEWLLREAEGIDVAAPKPGQRFTVGESLALPVDDWWTEVARSS